MAEEYNNEVLEAWEQEQADAKEDPPEPMTIQFLTRNAQCLVNHINHRVFLYQGQRWGCGWRSAERRYDQERGEWMLYPGEWLCWEEDNDSTE